MGYAVDSCWVAPTIKPVTDPMKDFPSTANCTEPWMISVTKDDTGGEFKIATDRTLN